MGYIKDGKYYKEKPDVSKLRRSTYTGWGEHDRNRQRKDFAKEILQPYNRDGTPNQDFVSAYPEESVGYGFLPDQEQLNKL